MGGVLEEGGTAPIARLAEYSAGGKTGTAQKVKDGRYAKGLYVSSFIGFAPQDDPKVVTLVVLDEPTRKWYGGTVAGPVFREVTTHALRELGIAPDLKTKQALVQSEEDSQQMENSFEESRLPVLTTADQGWTMPDLGGRPLRDVVKIFGPSGIDLEMEGFGLVTTQSPKPGSLLMPDDTVRIALSTQGGRGSIR
jgi:cell division protein FtsI (penicillin-binding protein 3)